MDSYVEQCSIPIKRTWESYHMNEEIAPYVGRSSLSTYVFYQDIRLITRTTSSTGPSGKFCYEALALKHCLFIFHDSTKCHTNPSVMYVHNLLKDT